MSTANDLRFGVNLTGVNGRFLRIGIDRPARDRRANEGPWMTQWWVIKRPEQRTHGHFMLLSPDDLRSGLQNRIYHGVGEQGLPCRLEVSGVGTDTIRVQKLYSASVGDSVSVKAKELTDWITKIIQRIDE